MIVCPQYVVNQTKLLLSYSHGYYKNSVSIVHRLKPSQHKNSSLHFDRSFVSELLIKQAWVMLYCEYIESGKTMTPVVQDFLATFDRLTDSASEILKQTDYLDFTPLSDQNIFLKIYILPFASSSKSA